MNRILFLTWVILVACGVLAGAALAQPLTATMGKASYGPGETVGILTTITNDLPEPRTLVIGVNIKGADSALPPAPLRVPVALAPKEQKTLTIQPLTVDDGIPPGNYQAGISLYDGKTLLSESRVSFTVTGTKKPLPLLEVLSCTDSGCTRRTSIFYSSSAVFLHYSPVVPDMTVRATVRGPGGSMTTLALPGQFIPSEEGVYVVSATAIKDGYAPWEGRLEFSVLNAPVTLIESRGIPVAQKPWPVFRFWLAAGIAAVVIAGIGAVVWFKKKRGEKKG